MKRKFNYFYKITNKLNGDFYYGVHKTDDLEDDYFGSGTRLGYAIKKYEKKNFEIEILDFFDTYEEALELESQIVNEELVNNQSCYNITKGGQGGWKNTYKGKEYYQTDEWKKRCSYAGKSVSLETRKRIWKSVPLEQRKKIAKKMGKEFGGRNKLSKEEIKERINKIKDINMNKIGWVSKVSKILGITHTQTKRFIDKYYRGDYYRR
jgi:ribosomal protein L20A (L18A)